MATRTYPAKSQPKGSISSFPGKAPAPAGRPCVIDDIHNPYFDRAKLGHDEETVMRMRRNDFGKKPQVQNEPPAESEAYPVMPRVIHGV